MPRPGPRPYECVRRAWHSDRHQPIRGSLIQEIFRVVSEVHSSVTKRNKEWQEKLPIVVLKAEEIMYSKANSEVEYMDFTTLWDRANDAINTIIRRDDSAETGDLVQPCIEAALHLGCIPRRASRSLRCIDPKRYLSPNLQEPVPGSHSNMKNSITSLNCKAMYSDIFKDAALSQQEVFEDNIPFKNMSFHFPQQTRCSRPMAPETCTASIQGHSVYPLYYWGGDPQLHCNFISMKKTSVKCVGSQKKPEDTSFSIILQTVPPISCDLSLRLGLSHGLEDTDKHRRSQEFSNKKSKCPVSTEMQLHLFHNEGDAKYLHLDKPGQKRKAIFLEYDPRPAEEMPCLLQPNLPVDCVNPRIIKHRGHSICCCRLGPHFSGMQGVRVVAVLLFLV